MTSSSFRVSIQFFTGYNEDAHADPATALATFLTTLLSQSPDRIVYSQITRPDNAQIELEFGFSSDISDKLNLIKQALIIAEGEAGFCASFPHGELFIDDCDLAWIDLVDPELPTGELFSVPFSALETLSVLSDKLVAGTTAYGFVGVYERRRDNSDLAKELIPAVRAAETKYTRIPGLRDDLRNTFDSLKSSGWQAREYLALELNPAQALIDFAAYELRESLQRSYPYISQELTKFRLQPASEALAISGAPGTIQEAIYRHRPEKYVLESIQKALINAKQKTNGGVPTPNATSVTPRTPQTNPPPRRPYAFFSYAHADAEAALEVMRSFRARGVEIWFDEAMPIGGIWDEILEDRIRHCDALIAFVSQNYDNSKYCRREIKFADVLNKPIFPLGEPTHRWGMGLQFLFQELQIHGVDRSSDIDVAFAEFQARLPDCVSH